jgi:hypothetical protein
LTPPEPNHVDLYMTKLAGIAGAFLSLNFVKGSWMERLIMACGGALVSLYGTPWLAVKTGLPEGLTGFLLGLFGMSICAKVWEIIQATPIADIWKSAIDSISKKP